MIQIIGLMIGLYIMLRSLSFATRSGVRAESYAVRAAAVIVLALTVVLVVLLLFSGSNMPD